MYAMSLNRQGWFTIAFSQNTTKNILKVPYISTLFPVKISGRVSPPQSAAVVFIVLQTSNRTNVRWWPAPARWLAVWRPMQFSNFHCLVSLVCDLPYIPGDTCMVRYIPGYTRVWYPWCVTSHTYQVTHV